MKRGRKGWSFQPITTSLNNATAELEALVCDTAPHIAVHDAPWEQTGLYTITHVPSGMTVGNFYTREYTFALADALIGVPGLEAETPGEATIEAARVALQAVSDAYEPPSPKGKSEPKPEYPPTRLSVVYRPGFTPSGAVQRADRDLGRAIARAMDGDLRDPARYGEARERAFQLAWEEEWMVRVDGLRREEVPARQPYRLLDGTLCDYKGFVGSRAKMDAIGDTLQQLALTILELAEGYAVWDRQDKRDWLDTTDEFSRLLREGAQEWSALAAHYIACTPEEKQEIIAELGFVGSKEQGYHALGEKTYLRHPEIRRAIAKRRIVEDWRKM